jgi:hypothetical protein
MQAAAACCVGRGAGWFVTDLNACAMPLRRLCYQIVVTSSAKLCVLTEEVVVCAHAGAQHEGGVTV